MERNQIEESSRGAIKGSVKDIGEEDRAFDDCFRPETTNVAGLHEAVLDSK